jgi:hypothetical protein
MTHETLSETLFGTRSSRGSGFWAAAILGRGRKGTKSPRPPKTPPRPDSSTWVERSRRFWDECFDRLEEYLEKLKRKP